MSGPDTVSGEVRGRSPGRRAAELALALVSVVAALAAGECAVRTFDLGPEFQIVFTEVFRTSEDPQLGYELRPGGRDGDATINAAGFRDRPFPARPAEGTFRIAAVGDSVTYGLGVLLAETWPKRLEALLGRCAPPGAPRFEVMNLGVPGYHAGQIARRTATLGLDHHPDLVVYAYVLNDAQRYSIEASALRELEARAERHLHDEVRRQAGRWLARSRLFLLARHAVSRIGAGPEFYDLDPDGVVRRRDDWIAVDVDPGRDPGHRAVTDEGDRRGRYFRQLHRSGEGRARVGAAFDVLANLPGDVPAAVVVFPLFLRPLVGPYPLADVHRQVVGWARDRGLPVADLTAAFLHSARRGRIAHADFVHPNAHGHWLAARRIARWLVDQGLVPIAEPEPGCLARPPTPPIGARSAARGSRAR